MTTEDDALLLGILDTVEEMNLPDDEAVSEIMKQFAYVYKKKVEDGSFRADPAIMKKVIDTIPHEFL